MLSTEGSCSRFTPTNYPQLQNLLRKDPSSYYEEFLQQEKYFKSLFDLYFKNTAFQPSLNASSLNALVAFLAHTAGCYPGKGNHLSLFIQQLIEIIRTCIERSETLILAKSLLPSLMIARHKCMEEKSKNLIIDFLFEILSKVPNLAYGYLLQEGKVTPNDRSFKKKIVSILSKRSEDPQNQQYDLLILRIGMEMFIKFKSWQEMDLVRAISQCALSNIAKVSLLAINFFLGGMSTFIISNDADAADRQETLSALRHSLHTSGKSRAKLRKEKTILKKLHDGAKLKEEDDASPGRGVNLVALNLLPDPDAFCEQLGNMFHEKQHATARSYEHRLLIIRLQSCLISHFKLIFPEFYEKILRYLKPTQKECTKILAYVANAVHASLNDELDDMEKEETPPSGDGGMLIHLLQAVSLMISRNFIAEYCRPEVVTVGLNVLREMATKCPQAISKTVLEDVLAISSDSNASKAMTNNKGVRMAAKALLSLYRTKAPKRLPIRLRGRPSSLENKQHHDEKHDWPNRKVENGFEKINTEKISKSNSETELNSEEEFDSDESAIMEQDADVVENQEEDGLEASDFDDNSETGSDCEQKEILDFELKTTNLLSEMEKRFLSQEELQLFQESNRENQGENQEEISMDHIQRGVIVGGKPSKEDRLLRVKAGREGRTYGKKHHSSQAKKRKQSKAFMMLIHKRGGPLSKSRRGAGVSKRAKHCR